MLATARNALVALGLGASAPAFGMDDSIFHDRPDPYPAAGAETRMAIAARTPPPVGGQDRWATTDLGERPTPFTDAIPIINDNLQVLERTMKWGFAIGGVATLLGGTALAVAARRREKRQENIFRVLGAEAQISRIRELVEAQEKLGADAWKDVPHNDHLQLLTEIEDVLGVCTLVQGYLIDGETRVLAGVFGQQARFLAEKITSGYEAKYGLTVLDPIFRS